jgi:hypothetical protein
MRESVGNAPIGGRKKNIVRNTATEFTGNPALNPALPIFGGSSEAILRQEAAGQFEVCVSDVLPVRGVDSVRKMIEDAGGHVGEAVSGDDLFVHVTVPRGWKKQASDHSMWSYLLDANGCKRAEIFYKAAFYDRSAHVSACHRFGMDLYSNEVTPEGSLTASICDARGLVSHAVNGVVDPLDDERSKVYRLRDRVAEELRLWLNENYPLWEDSSAYWAD